MQSLFELLNGIRPLSDALQQHLLSILQHTSLKKGDILLRQGQICRQICYIKSGLLHSYTQKGDKRVTRWLMPEKNIIISVKSFFLQVPSPEYIEAYEDSELYFITFDELMQTCEDFLEFNVHFAKLAVKYYVLENGHRMIIQDGSANERFEWFLSSLSGLTGRVPARHIASFIGIREETFSRIKSRL